MPQLVLIDALGAAGRKVPAAFPAPHHMAGIHMVPLLVIAGCWEEQCLQRDAFIYLIHHLAFKLSLRTLCSEPLMK